jgi:hypothetical protein
VFALIEGRSFGEIAMRVHHKVGLGLLAAKAVGPASVRRIDSAIRLNVLMIGKTPGTLIAEFASRGFWVPKQEAPTGLGLAEASRFWKGRLVMATSSKLMIAPLAKEETRRDNAVGKDYQ